MNVLKNEDFDRFKIFIFYYSVNQIIVQNNNFTKKVITFERKKDDREI